MNIYEKLNAARLQIAEKGLSKTGNNTFSGFKYFELSEILPVVTKVNNELKLFSAFSFLRDTATLEIVNAEKPDEKITFSFAYSPDGAKLKACHQIQNEGAVQTYIKRYLYQNAYEIAEADSLDSSIGAEDKKPTTNKNKRPFSEVIEDLQDDYPQIVCEVLKAHNCKKASDVAKTEQANVYSEIMNKVKQFEDAATKAGV